jgi:hypothetical protein
MNAKSILTACFLLALFVPAVTAQKSISAPAFKPGEVFFYLVHVKSSHDIKTKSALAFPEPPTAAIMDVSGILEVVALGTDSSGARLRTWFLSLVSDVESHPRGAKPDSKLYGYERIPASGKFVDFTLKPNGQIDQIEGLDQFASEQQTTWREWAARFSSAFSVASQARKQGDKWSTEEPENSPSPVAELLWKQKSHYAKDEPCAPQKFSQSGSFERSSSQEPCAVVLSTASLLQKSSTQDSTPQDYKLKGLKTHGAAKGNNDTILYISRKTGQLIRSVQDAKQQMDVTIALADGRSVHYAINATAHFTVELVTDLPVVLHPGSNN